MKVNIIWGSTSGITEVLAGSPAYGLTYDPIEGTDYTVTNNGDGTGTFAIKKELTNQLPIPISQVPDGFEMLVTVKYDQGEKNIVIKVTSGPVISPTVFNLNKNDLADMTVNIIWGNATGINEVLAGSPAYGLTYDPVEGTDYTISDNGDGTGTFVIKKELTNQLPVPINMVPDGAEMVVTIKFNQGEEKNIVIKVISFGSISGRVLDNEDNPIVGAYVSAIPLIGNGSHGAITDASGNYRILNLVSGEYTISVQADDWVTQFYSENVTVTTQNTPNINFTLQQPAIDECFIATAAFGSKLDWPVALLRQFRDKYLLTNSLGKAFVGFYYKNSPPIAAMVANSQPLKMLVRLLLAPVIALVYLLYHPMILVAILFLLIALFVLRRSRLRKRYI